MTTPTEEFIQVETPDSNLSRPYRLYKVKLQTEADIPRTIKAVFWPHLSEAYHILLAEDDWPPLFIGEASQTEEVIIPFFSSIVPEKINEIYASEWASRLAP